MLEVTQKSGEGQEKIKCANLSFHPLIYIYIKLRNALAESNGPYKEHYGIFCMRVEPAFKMLLQTLNE